MSSRVVSRAVHLVLERSCDPSERTLLTEFINRIDTYVEDAATMATVAPAVREWFTPGERQRIGELLEEVMATVDRVPVERKLCPYEVPLCASKSSLTLKPQR